MTIQQNILSGGTGGWQSAFAPVVMVDRIGTTTVPQTAQTEPADRAALHDRVRNAIARQVMIYDRRAKIMGKHGWGDPRWRLLLTLADADIRHDPLTVTDCGLAANVPMSTTVRTLRELEGERLVRRFRDPNDQRRIYVHLTSAAMQELITIFLKEF